MSVRRWCKLLLCTVAALALVPATAAFAHASFLGSDPVDGSVLTVAPRSVSLRFSEALLLDATRVTLTRLGPGSTETLPLTAVDGGRTLVAELPPLGDGAYLLRFRAVDPADLHTTVGQLSFGVGMAAPSSSSGNEVGSSWWVTALRAVTDAALVLVVGSVVVVWLAARRRICTVDATRLAVIGAVATAMGWIASFVAEVGALSFTHARWGTLLVSSDPGRRALVGIELALGIWWAARFMRMVPPASRELIAHILLILGGGMVLLAALGGHSGIGGSAGAGVVLRTVHLGSMCVWIGSIGVLCRVSRTTRHTRALWPEVSRLAAVGIGLTGASGLLLSGRTVATVTALLGTVYGRQVIGKVLVLLVLGGLGWFAARRVARAGTPRRVPVELGCAAFALLLAASMAGGSPPVGARFTPVVADPPQVVTGDAADLTVSAQLQPARPGPNLIRVAVLETRRPSPGAVRRVMVSLRRADGTVAVSRDGVPSDGVVEWADIDVAAPGDYRLVVAVDRPDAAVPEFDGELTVRAPRPQHADTVLSDAAWASIAGGLAAVWLFAVAVGWMEARRVRARTGIRSPVP